MVDKVRLGAHDVRVIVGPLEREDAGQTNTQANTISIQEGMAPSQTSATLLHEICHFWLSGMPLSADFEEFLALSLESSLASFLRDNPALVRDMLKTFEE